MKNLIPDTLDTIDIDSSYTNSTYILKKKILIDPSTCSRWKFCVPITNQCIFVHNQSALLYTSMATGVPIIQNIVHCRLSRTFVSRYITWFHLTLSFNPSNYLQSTWNFLEFSDVVSGLVKASVFGFIITLMGCYHGYNSKGGAHGVGMATTNAVVSASILILCSDYILTEIFFSK